MKKKRRPILTPQNWEKSIVDEIRAIRGQSVSNEEEAPPLLPQEGVVCSLCAGEGDHICLTRLYNAIENDDTCAEYCWQIYVNLVDAGHISYVEES